MTERIFIHDRLDMDRIGRELREVGAISLPCLADGFLRTLADEARTYSYRRGREIIGSGEREVRQDLYVCDDFAPHSAFRVLAHAFEELLETAARRQTVYPFGSRLHLDDLMLQKYEGGSAGISPHRDRSAYINVVCVFTLTGRAEFLITADRKGHDAVAFEAVPGSVILMRAPGFEESSARPFHAVRGIRETRYAFGLRQRAEATNG